MEDAIEQSAREIIERRGTGAIDWLNERIRQLEAAGDRPALDTTYRILSAVERILNDGKAR